MDDVTQQASGLGQALGWIAALGAGAYAGVLKVRALGAGHKRDAAAADAETSALEALQKHIDRQAEHIAQQDAKIANLQRQVGSLVVLLARHGITAPGELRD